MAMVGARGSLKNGMLHYATVMLVVFFMIPFAIMIATSFYHRVGTGTYEPGFEFTHYLRFFSPLFVQHLGVSVYFSVLASLAAVAIATPFSYLLARCPRRLLVLILTFVLCVISLSEVIVSLSWSILLSRTAGVSNLLVWLGIMDRPQSWSRGFWAVLMALTYFNLPFAILILFPHCSRIDKALLEAAATLGARPPYVFGTVVLPILWPSILTCFIILFVFTMGAYVTPQWLGRPEDWMYAILIVDQAIFRNNVPFAAALAIFFLATTLFLTYLSMRLGRRRPAS